MDPASIDILGPSHLLGFAITQIHKLKAAFHIDTSGINTNGLVHYFTEYRSKRLIIQRINHVMYISSVVISLAIAFSDRRIE